MRSMKNTTVFIFVISIDKSCDENVIYNYYNLNEICESFYYLCMDSFMKEITSVAAKNQNKDVQSLCPTTTIQSPTIVLSLLTMTRIYSVFLFIKRTTKSAEFV